MLLGQTDPHPAAEAGEDGGISQLGFMEGPQKPAPLATAEAPEPPEPYVGPPLRGPAPALPLPPGRGPREP